MASRAETALGLERPLPLVRAVIGAEIDRLIAMLDALDPDPEMEDGGDAEPALGWREDAGKGCPPSWVYLASAEQGVPMQDDDREEEHDREAVDEDGEDDSDSDGEFEGSGCHDGDNLKDLAELAEAWMEATPERRQAALAYARQMDAGREVAA